MTLSNLTNPHTIAAILVAIATFATIMTVALPLISGDQLGKRMKSVASERERIRAREREKLNAGKSLRYEPKAYMKRIVERFNAESWLGTAKAKEQMLKAGFRGAQAEIAFLFFRLVAPLLFLVVGAFYIFVVASFTWPFTIKIAAVMFSTYLGLKAPEIFIANTIKKRQQSVSRAFPDAMDLLLICVESGMSIEAAFRKVGTEIGIQSIPLAEELTLTTAELSFLPERRTAYDNLAKRTGIESIKQIVTVLTQAEKYGTPARSRAPRAGAGEPGPSSAAGRAEGRRLAAQADRADDRVLPAGALRGHPDTGLHPDLGPELRRHASVQSPVSTVAVRIGCVVRVAVRRACVVPSGWGRVCLRDATFSAASIGVMSRRETSSAAAYLPSMESTMARFWRTRASASGCAAACRRVDSASAI